MFNRELLSHIVFNHLKIEHDTNCVSLFIRLLIVFEYLLSHALQVICGKPSRVLVSDFSRVIFDFEIALLFNPILHFTSRQIQEQMQ